MTVGVAKPLGLAPFVQQAMKQSNNHFEKRHSMGGGVEKNRREAEIRHTAQAVALVAGPLAAAQVTPQRVEAFSAGFETDISMLGGKLRAMLGETPSFQKDDPQVGTKKTVGSWSPFQEQAEYFNPIYRYLVPGGHFSWTASTDASTNDEDLESNAALDSDAEDEVEDEGEGQNALRQRALDSEVEDEAEEEDEAEGEKEYKQMKSDLAQRYTEVVEQPAVTYYDVKNNKRAEAMREAHQPIPGAKSGRESGSMRDYYSYGKSMMSDMFRKRSAK